ncbi:DUF4976 domain-containing protein [Ornithobacterium rhinotracheale]|uniref:sulfatase n=1 Tax=Ornithobacterium rhinotracheale TaxID=28251 RepID=UPI00129C3935|nr:sulfatase [Ornithobacterium rhinotracheale]MRJ08088.1 DUF4976 domain-containing protein [Ornithobacterium rhinotracheale]UOH78404.1 sulfatase [Ornithobacterium rhinotracheale]
MKKIIIGLSCLCMSCVSVWKKESKDYSRNFIDKDKKRPNIILFLVDDMGWQDTSVPFWKERTPLNDIYHTPNMERLAKQGLKFTQAYAAPVCSPTRVSLMTGTNPARHRVIAWTLKYNVSNHYPSQTLEQPAWNMNGMCTEPNVPNTYHATALPQILKDNGYYTIHAGKAHFGAIGTPDADPLNIGFNVNIAGHAGGGLRSYEGLENFGNTPEMFSYQSVPGLEEFYGKDIFLTEALTQKALKELDRRPRNKPFFLYLSHYAVHIPIMGDKRFLQKYIDKGLNETEAKYASLIEGMDKSLGDVMDYLEKNHLKENTILLFMSDNGGLDRSNRGRSTNTCNAPLSSGKGSLREGGIREPMIVFWENHTKPNSETNQKVIIEDFFPTILELAKIKNYKTIQPIDGQSFVPVLKNEKMPQNRILYWHAPNNWNPKFRSLHLAPSSAIREGDFKLIYYHDTQEFELFNLKDDIGEKYNLAQKYPEKLKSLAVKLSKYLRQTHAQMPIIKATGTPVPLPDERFN